MNDYPSIWGGGQLLAFSGLSGQTDYFHSLCLQTGKAGYCFELKNIDMNKKIDSVVEYTGASPDKVELTGEFFRFHAGRSCSCGVLPDARHLLLQGDFGVRLDPDYEMIRKEDRILIGLKGMLDASLIDLDPEEKIRELGAVLQEAPLPADLGEDSLRTAVKALSQLKSQLWRPEGNIRHLWSTPDRWPHRMMWLWDSVFHALGLRHYRPDLARQIIDAVFDLQQDDGFIPLRGNPEIRSDMSQPPVLGLAMKLINESAPAPAWIREQAPKLGRFIEWIMKNRDSDGAGLVEWLVTGDPMCRSGESGMDNSPRFDEAVQLDATDFNSYLAFECEALAEFLPEQRDYWLGHYHRLCSLISSRLWNDDQQFFLDYDVTRSHHLDILASSGFLPLYCGAATPEQARKLAEHLENPETFGTPLRVPSIARCHKREYSKDMWRGPVWVNINYMIALGLERYQFHDLAREIIRQTMREEEKWYIMRGTFFEFYDDRQETAPWQMDRKGKRAPDDVTDINQPLRDYGWSGTLYLEMINHKEWR